MSHKLNSDLNSARKSSLLNDTGSTKDNLPMVRVVLGITSTETMSWSSS